MSTAPEFDFEMHQGDTKRLRVTVVDETGAAKSLVGAQNIRWWVARKVTSTTKLIQKSTTGGIVVNDASGGILTIEIDPADTQAVSGEYYHELEVVDAADDVGTVLRGTMTVVRALVADPPTP